MDVIKLGKPNHKAQNGEMTRRMSVFLSNLKVNSLQHFQGYTHSEF